MVGLREAMEKEERGASTAVDAVDYDSWSDLDIKAAEAGKHLVYDISMT